MRNRQPTALEAARATLEEAKRANDKTQAALSLLEAPFTNQVTALKDQISQEQKKLNSFRRELSKVLDDDQAIESLEEQIAGCEKLLKRLAGRVEIADQWRERERESLTKLYSAIEDADSTLTTTHADFVEALKGHVLLIREQYIEACGELWSGMKEAAEHTRFRLPTRAELSVDFDELKTQFGPLPSFVGGGVKMQQKWRFKNVCMNMRGRRL